jgi:hypothetical protein
MDCRMVEYGRFHPVNRKSSRFCGSGGDELQIGRVGFGLPCQTHYGRSAVCMCGKQGAALSREHLTQTSLEISKNPFFQLSAYSEKIVADQQIEIVFRAQGESSSQKPCVDTR